MGARYDCLTRTVRHKLFTRHPIRPRTACAKRYRTSEECVGARAHACAIRKREKRTSRPQSSAQPAPRVARPLSPTPAPTRGRLPRWLLPLSTGRLRPSSHTRSLQAAAPASTASAGTISVRGPMPRGGPIRQTASHRAGLRPFARMHVLVSPPLTPAPLPADRSPRREGGDVRDAARGLRLHLPQRQRKLRPRIRARRGREVWALAAPALIRASSLRCRAEFLCSAARVGACCLTTACLAPKRAASPAEWRPPAASGSRPTPAPSTLAPPRSWREDGITGVHATPTSAHASQAPLRGGPSAR